MARWVWLVLLPVSLFAAGEGRRIEAYLLLGDALSACQLAEKAVADQPDDPYLRELFVRALAQGGKELEMVLAWRGFASCFPKEAEKPALLEAMAWGVVEKGSRSTAPLIRLFSLLAGFLSRDGRGAEMVAAAVRDENSRVRKAALQMAATLQDDLVKRAVLERLTNERVWDTRLQAIVAAGQMGIVQAEPQLLLLLSDPRAQVDEREAAAAALVALVNGATHQQLTALCLSKRAGLRLLGCRLIERFEKDEVLELLLPLTNDRHLEVRLAALRALGRLHPSSIGQSDPEELALELTKDATPSVAITASWLLSLYHPKAGGERLERWLFHPRQQFREEACAALLATGEVGRSLMEKAFHLSNEMQVRANMALGLIGLRHCCGEACQAVDQLLKEQGQRWFWRDYPLGRVLTTHGQRPENPEMINQLTRLELFERLAILEYPGAVEGVAQLLQRRNWGVSGLAAALLLTEAEEEALELIEPLLAKEDSRLSIQAALLLAFWGREEGTLTLLQAAYPNADREMKERILEAIGRVGKRASIPFLAQQLGSVHQTERIAAAAALLQCLYN